MPPRAPLAALAAAVLAAAAPAARAAERRPWFVPDQLKLQFAGNVGFLSPGVGYAWADRRLEADLFLGWVPRAVGGDDIVSFTGKLTWLPWRVPVHGPWLLQPFSAALQITYTRGHDYFVQVPKRYGPGYYDFPTALRAGIGFGGALAREGNGAFREVAVYAELVALDAMLFLWGRNRDALGLTDVFSLALGVRFAF